jgi:hypothetical protein
MSGYKYNFSLIIVLISLSSVQVFSQQINYRDSFAVVNSQKEILQPRLHYTLGNTFVTIPKVGSVAGISITPFLSVPLSPKLSVDGGIIAGRYSLFGNLNHEGAKAGEFNELSVFGSASYHVNSQLTLYGTGIKQLTNSSPFLLPKSNYVIGSSYNFGSFSIGLSVQMSKWNDYLRPSPFNNFQGFYSPFEQRLTH